jgi:hypothetical protein
MVPHFLENSEFYKRLLEDVRQWMIADSSLKRMFIFHMKSSSGIEEFSIFVPTRDRNHFGCLFEPIKILKREQVLGINA